MERDARRLAEYCQDRVGDALRGVGYHTTDDYGVVQIREDVKAQYPPERVDRFVEVSQCIHGDLSRLDEMGTPEASLHTLAEGLIIQFHRDGGVIFVVLDSEVGRNFTQFIDDCLDQIS